MAPAARTVLSGSTAPAAPVPGRRRPGPPFSAMAVAAAALAAVVLTGCGAGGDSASPSTTTRPATSSSSSTAPETDTTGGQSQTDWDCPDAADVQEVVGAPVESTPSSGAVGSSSADFSISYSHSGCDYELTGGGDADIEIGRITEHDADGRVFDVLEQATIAEYEKDGMEPLPDLGDDAYRVGGEVAVLLGDVMAFIEGQEDEEPSFSLSSELAESLLSEGAGILQTGELDCDELGAVAPTSFGTLSSAMGASGATVIDDLTIQSDGCFLEFDSGRSAEVQVSGGSQWDAWVAAEQGSMFTVLFESIELAGFPAFDDGETLLVDDGDQPLRVTAEGADLAGDPAEIRRSLAELALG